MAGGGVRGLWVAEESSRLLAPADVEDARGLSVPFFSLPGGVPLVTNDCQILAVRGKEQSAIVALFSRKRSSRAERLDMLPRRRVMQMDRAGGVRPGDQSTVGRIHRIARAIDGLER